MLKVGYGADIIVKSETAEILAKELSNLTRFEKSKLEVSEISNLRKKEIKVENIDIIVPSLRLDNIVSDLARTSRSKAVQILNQERVFINGKRGKRKIEGKNGREGWSKRAREQNTSDRKSVV